MRYIPQVFCRSLNLYYFVFSTLTSNVVNGVHSAFLSRKYPMEREWKSVNSNYKQSGDKKMTTKGIIGLRVQGKSVKSRYGAKAPRQKQNKEWVKVGTRKTIYIEKRTESEAPNCLLDTHYQRGVRSASLRKTNPPTSRTAIHGSKRMSSYMAIQGSLLDSPLAARVHCPSTSDEQVPSGTRTT